LVVKLLVSKAKKSARGKEREDICAVVVSVIGLAVLMRGRRGWEDVWLLADVQLSFGGGAEGGRVEMGLLQVIGVRFGHREQRGAETSWARLIQ
jgi:hypothetical protein